VNVGRRARAALVLLVSTFASPALGDRGETYVVLGFSPGMTRYKLGRTGSGETTNASSTFNVTAYYGLSNTWHVGGRLRTNRTTNLHVANATTDLNRIQTVGDVYEDHLGLGLDGVILYRVDTHYPLAPLIELAGGVTSHQFSRIAFIPARSTYSYSRPSIHNVALHGGATVLLEYRFATRWVAAAGVSAEAESGDVPSSFTVPLRLGAVW
jgi:hypothetical protein